MPLDENVPLDQLEEGEPNDEPLDEPNDEPNDEPLDEPNDEPLDEPNDEPAPQPASRGETRMQRLANERAEAKAEAKLAKEQAEFYRRQVEQFSQQRQQPQEPEYVDPDEKWRRDTESKVNQALFSANDLNDKAAYAMQKVTNPQYAKYEARVEAELQSIRQKGGNATREGVLAFLVGKDVLANNGKPTRASKQASERVAAARSAPVGNKSNVAPARGEKTAADRLNGIIL
jgi:hypothetical protein